MKSHYLKTYYLILSFSVVLISVKEIRADEFQVGLTSVYLTHNDNSFSGGLYRIRPGLYNAFYRVVAYQPFQPYSAFEFYFRYTGPIGDNHSFGLAIGQELTGRATTTEIRSVYITKLNQTFEFNYLLFTYHYSIPIQSYFRNVSLEIGGGMGILPMIRWRIDGYQTDYNNFNKRYNALIESNNGFQYRLEAALVKKWKAIVFRLGIRFDYRLAGDFTGIAGGNSVRPFTLTDGTHALTPDLLDIIELNQSARNQYLDLSLKTQGIVKGHTEMLWGTNSLFLSVGFRF